jgi:hypothetical protein
MSTQSVSKSRGSTRRQQLFELFSQNLSNVKKHPRIQVQPDFDEGYICPICFKLFDREALSTEYDDHLTLEDVPPKSLGGRVVALTCKICNNWAGAQLESHLSGKLRADAFLAGVPDIEMDARFRPDPSVDLTATIRLMPDRGIGICYDPDRSSPGDIDKLHELEKAGDISSINVQVLLGYKANRPEVALLRIAYLLAFARFGYGFLMNNYLVRVRHQIQNPAEKMLSDWGILRAEFPDSVVGISVIYEPKDLQCFLVVFDLDTDVGRSRYGVVLPGPTQPGFSIYDRMAELKRAESKVPIEHKIRVIPEEDYLQDPRLAFASHHYWNDFRE